MQRWDEIQIEEETEEGETVKSKIRIPMQVSKDFVFFAITIL